MLTYRFDPNVIEIREQANEDDKEFHIRILVTEPYVQQLKGVQRYFEDNEDFTDVLFYVYANHEYKVIVHKDHYAEFLAELLKHRLLLSLAWDV